MPLLCWVPASPAATDIAYRAHAETAGEKRISQDNVFSESDGGNAVGSLLKNVVLLILRNSFPSADTRLRRLHIRRQLLSIHSFPESLGAIFLLCNSIILCTSFFMDINSYIVSCDYSAPHCHRHGGLALKVSQIGSSIRNFLKNPPSAIIHHEEGIDAVGLTEDFQRILDEASFFRDKEAFQPLGEKVIHPLVTGKKTFACGASPVPRGKRHTPSLF